MVSAFPIPASLQDLEREPYNLLPYPEDFADDDEASRAESFDELVRVLERGNRGLVSNGAGLFETTEEDFEPWNDNKRIQALYTLVRKSSSIAPSTKKGLIDCLCNAVVALSNILSTAASTATENSDESTKVQSVMSQEFRDAFACHIYMLFSVMFFTESEAKVANTMVDARRVGSKADAANTVTTRSVCANAMLAAAKSMKQNRSFLWQLGVPDEAVAVLPCRISYQMLESATGVTARRAACADAALSMIAFTVDSSDSLIGTIVAALMDLLHSYEHIAPMVAEVCTMVSEEPTNKLAVELIREIGRLHPSIGSYGGKSSGVKNLAPFISELASLRPRIVLANMSHLLPHLNSEPYGMRSAIVAAIGSIVVHISKGSADHGGGGLEILEGSTRNISSLGSRNSLLDVLYERVHDVSSYTRVAVLKVWINIVQTGSLPLEHLMPVTSLAIDRLQDKTVMVRRSSMQLLTTLLENNPYLGSLDPKPYRKKLVELHNVLMDTLPEDLQNAHVEAIKDVEGDEATIRQLEKATVRAAMAEVDSMEESDPTKEQRDFRSTVLALKFSQSALDFIHQFEHANEALEAMLLSANTSDVTEALRFFVKARHFSLPCAVTGMKQALALMWASEQIVRDEVLKAFVEVFVAVPGTEGKRPLPENQIAQNLLTLVGRATVSELASIEEALGRLVQDEKIPANVFLILWSIVAKANGSARAAAMLVLSMGASADRSIVDSASRLRLLLEECLGDATKERHDWNVAKSAALALQRINVAKVEAGSAKAIVLEQIVERLCVVIRGDWCQDDQPQDTMGWFSAAEQSITALFDICGSPEVECADVIRSMICSSFGMDEGSRASTCHSLRLARFFFVVGHIALKLLVYSESISGAVRRANAKKTLKKQEQADKSKEQARANGDDDGGDDEEDGIEAQLGVAAELEAENERRVADISEKEILGRGLISNFSPLLIRVVGNEGGRFDSAILRQSAALALCKFMCISSSFCEENLPLLFTALMEAPEHDTTLRANIVVALGDIAFRFPNEAEPYIPRLYARLRDPATKVRRHTLMVLTHLILNDMVKLKGQVCEIAMCLQDGDLRIRDMSRLLFHELSKRSNNPIYNLLPDIISQLSRQSLKKEDFRSIMTFLLGFIKKARQNEMLVEKLCQRFPKSTSISQKADLAYCIAQLKINERSIKCLNDNFKLYKDALFDEDVKKSFFTMVTKVKKNGKPEFKESIEEWEGRLQECTEQSQSNREVGESASRAKAKAKKRAARKRGTRNRKDVHDGSDTEECTGKENASSATTNASKLSDRSRRGNRRSVLVDDN